MSIFFDYGVWWVAIYETGSITCLVPCNDVHLLKELLALFSLPEISSLLKFISSHVRFLLNAFLLFLHPKKCCGHNFLFSLYLYL